MKRLFYLVQSCSHLTRRIQLHVSEEIIKISNSQGVLIPYATNRKPRRLIAAAIAQPVVIVIQKLGTSVV